MEKKKIKIRKTFWGATPSEVENLEQWENIGSRDPRFLCFSGLIFGSDCTLIYFFNGDNELRKITYHFKMSVVSVGTNETLYNDLERVLLDKYGCRANNYKEVPTWIVHSGQTAIQLIDKREYPDRGSIEIVMSYNGEDIQDRKIDYYKQALKEL